MSDRSPLAQTIGIGRGYRRCGRRLPVRPTWSGYGITPMQLQLWMGRVLEGTVKNGLRQMRM